MEQNSLQYTLEGPDGTTVVIDGAVGGSSQFRVRNVDGLDSPNVRQNIEELPEADGAAVGDFWLGSRSIIIDGLITAESAALRNAAIANLARASMALRADATLKFQPAGMPALQVKVRREQRLLVAGGFVKEFQLALVAYDPRLYSQTLNTQTAIGTAGAPGAAFPWAFPVDFGGGTGATLTVSCTNAGNYETAPIVKVYGPVSNPQLKNATTGESVFIDGLTLASGQWLEVDLGVHTVKNQDGVNFYDRVRFPGTVWWFLHAGSNTVQLWGTGTSGATQIDVSWRDAWA